MVKAQKSANAAKQLGYVLQMLIVIVTMELTFVCSDTYTDAQFEAALRAVPVLRPKSMAPVTQ